MRRIVKQLDLPQFLTKFIVMWHKLKHDMDVREKQVILKIDRLMIDPDNPKLSETTSSDEQLNFKEKSKPADLQAPSHEQQSSNNMTLSTV